MKKLGYNKKLAVLITYNIILENIFQNHFGKHFQSNFGFCVPKYLNFRITFSKKVNFWKIKFEILEYERKKNLKITLKSISENILKKKEF
jgi:hypothetical protein